MSFRTHSRFAVLTATGAVLATGVGFPAAAATGDQRDISVVNTETVQVYTDATGKVESTRLYEQLALTGDGTAKVTNPAELDGLRNLDGFGGFDVKDGNQVLELDVDGTENFRTVSNFDGELPLDIEVSYELDGETVEPSDLVGASGDLEVSYTVKNITGRTDTVSFDDGNGGEVSKDVTVTVPMVGSLTTVLPESFRDVKSDQANLAGDGRGNTKASFTMTLVPPVGSDTATFGYTAELKDAVLPRASVSALPVNPFEVPSFASAGESYEAGAQKGIDLTAGASEIDANLLKLRDGAGELLGGLLQLRDGANELNAGLQGKAAPGAGKLADGAGRLDDGLGQIDDGAQLLADGSGQLADGTGRAYAGSKDLTEGLGRISAGLDQLAGVEGLPKAQAGISQLQAGVAVLSAGLGTADDPETLIGGLAKLQGGLGQLEGGSAQLVGGLQQLAGAEGLLKAKGGVDQVHAGLKAAAGDSTGVQQLVGNLNQLKVYGDLITDPAAKAQFLGTINAIIAGVQQSAQDQGAKLQGAIDGLAQVSAGLGNAIGALNTQLIPGAQQVNGGIATAKSGAGDLQAGAVQVKGGIGQVSDGLDQLAIGLGSAVSGVFQLSDGAGAAYDGSGELSSGLGLLDRGALALSGGAGQLADGTGAAAVGSGELMAGAQELAEGLIDAADGSGLLADGLGQAADGAPRLRDGAQELSDRGTKKLVAKGEETAQEYGEMYAVLEAGADRADAEKMVVGAPEDAIGLAAYSFEIQGEDGEGNRNLVRGLAALALLAAGGVVLTLRHRLGRRLG